VRVAVGRVQHAAGKDGGAAAQIAVALGAAQHQHFQALRAVAQQQQRCRPARVGLACSGLHSRLGTAGHTGRHQGLHLGSAVTGLLQHLGGVLAHLRRRLRQAGGRAVKTRRRVPAAPRRPR
jgi:hypothetical protein